MNVQNIYCNQTALNVNFAKKQKKSSADKFINDLQKEEKDRVEGNFFTRNFGTTTGTIPLYAAFAYQIHLIIKENKLKKTLPLKDFAKIHKKNSNKLLTATIVAFLLIIGINKAINSQNEKNYADIKKQFAKYNTKTDAKLADKMIYSGYIGALYNPATGIIQLNRNAINDPIIGRKNDKLIKHELVHAKQYELVARSKDGIKKINYSIINEIANTAKANPFVAKEFEQIYNDIIKSGNKYDKTNITIFSSNINLKDYITAIHILMNNSKATYNDIPIVIDEKHYQNVIDKNPPLTPEEKVKADEYYQAMLDYKSVNFLSALNPFSLYRQNILEKEAYKENPSLMTKLSNLYHS